MSKTASQSQRDLTSIQQALKPKTGDALNYRAMFDVLNKIVPFAEGFIVASVPRGGLQIVQPTKVPDVLVKAYSREAHLDDRATWQCLAKKKPLRGTEAWGNSYDQSKYLRDFLLYNCNLYHMVAVPLKAPVFAGYPGALHLYRYREQGAFTDAEIAKLVEYAKAIDGSVEQQRVARRPAACTYQAAWAHRLPQKQFVFDAKSKCIYNNETFSPLDERLRQQIVQHCQQRLSRLGDVPLQADRLQVPDSRGDLWTFHVIPFQKASAFNDGPCVFFCLQPEACDWATVRPTDYSSDQEMVRLVPSLRFMQNDFHRSPSLGEIAKQVHLSPFHFHRRFTELMGLTPKHFLLESQIFEAKRQLMARQKDLAQIAADCGFAHQSHFTSRFKQATGLTPTRWRKVAQDLQREHG